MIYFYFCGFVHCFNCEFVHFFKRIVPHLNCGFVHLFNFDIDREPTYCIVQGPLDAAQPFLSGEMHPINPLVPSQLFSSPSPPINSRVSDKLKAKIWNDEYFELGALLTNIVHESRYQVTLARTTTEQLSSLYLEPVAKPRKIFTIETWLSCFHIFVVIYTRRYPHEAAAPMKYCGVIQDLAASGFNCCFYNNFFFFLRQVQPCSFRWCSIH